jgi:diguanylate cyclase (GGDEF)-like protein
MNHSPYDPTRERHKPKDQKSAHLLRNLNDIFKNSENYEDPEDLPDELKPLKDILKKIDTEFEKIEQGEINESELEIINPNQVKNRGVRGIYKAEIKHKFLKKISEELLKELVKKITKQKEVKEAREKRIKREDPKEEVKEPQIEEIREILLEQELEEKSDIFNRFINLFRKYLADTQTKKEEIDDFLERIEEKLPKLPNDEHNAIEQIKNLINSLESDVQSVENAIEIFFQKADIDMWLDEIKKETQKTLEQEPIYQTKNGKMIRAFTDSSVRKVFNKLKTNIKERQEACNEDSIALIHFDIDNFKPINDTYSHVAGDKVLGKLIEKLKEKIRDSDIIGRVGGDEFVILGAINSNKNGAEKFATRIENILSDFSVELDQSDEDLDLNKERSKEKNKTVSITISGGMKVLNTDSNNWKSSYDEVKHEADATAMNTKKITPLKTEVSIKQKTIKEEVEAEKKEEENLNIIKLALKIAYSSNKREVDQGVFEEIINNLKKLDLQATDRLRSKNSENIPETYSSKVENFIRSELKNEKDNQKLAVWKHIKTKFEDEIEYILDEIKS